MINPTFHGEVKHGKLLLDHPEQYLVYLSGLEGKRVELSLQKERNARTLSQNRYYWAVVVEILAEHFGYDKEEMHEALKFKFLRKERELTTVSSTAKLNVGEFCDYIDRVMRWAASEHGVYIPDAGDIIL